MESTMTFGDTLTQERYRQIAEHPETFDARIVGLEETAGEYAKESTHYYKYDRGIEVPKEVHTLAIALFVEKVANEVLDDVAYFIDSRDSPFTGAWREAEKEAFAWAERIGHPTRELTDADYEED